MHCVLEKRKWAEVDLYWQEGRKFVDLLEHLKSELRTTRPFTFMITSIVQVYTQSQVDERHFAGWPTRTSR